MTQSSPKPLVSVAIPLFNSAQFLSYIVDNIEAIDYPNVEIIISDRHCDDDCIDTLKYMFNDNPRVKFLKNTDRISWVDHYNSLLLEASGQYFMWMPHDDSFTSDYISKLVEVLESSPQIVLAFGYIDSVSLSGEPCPVRFRAPPFPGGESSGVSDSLKLLFWGAGLPFRGVFRRDTVIKNNHFLRSTYQTVGADTYWVFGLSLFGNLRFIDFCGCTKRFYPESTHGRASTGIRYIINGFNVMRAYIREHVPNRKDSVLAVAGIFLWSLQRYLKLTRNLLPPTLKAQLWRIYPSAIKPGLSRYE